MAYITQWFSVGHCKKIKITKILISSITNELKNVSHLNLLNQNNTSYFLTSNLLCNDILKTSKGRFLISIGRAFQSGKALFMDLSKPQLVFNLMARIVSFERVLWL